MNDILYIIVPCYNEEKTLGYTFDVLEEALKSLVKKGFCSLKSRVVFVDDGSKDNTFPMLKEECAKNRMFSYVKLSKNFGHQYALLAGLKNAEGKADVTITIDADLQQDVNAMEAFLKKYNEGYDIVYGVRKTRDTDGFLKKTTAGLFYGLINKLGGKTIRNHADYRLLSAKALSMLNEFKETNLFLRGMIPMCSDNSCIVYFDVKPREYGESKYTAKKMFTLAIDGITSLSIKPIRLITGLGIGIFVLSVIISIAYFITFLVGNTVSGWTSLILSIWALGGLQLMTMGVVGEYVGKSYMESKQRPRYLVDEVLIDEEFEIEI